MFLELISPPVADFINWSHNFQYKSLKVDPEFKKKSLICQLITWYYLGLPRLFFPFSFGKQITPGAYFFFTYVLILYLSIMFLFDMSIESWVRKIVFATRTNIVACILFVSSGSLTL